MESKQQKEQPIKRCKPRLERLNAVKNVEYKEVVTVVRGASWSNSCPSESIETLNLRTAKSLDVFPSLYTKQSFRIDGSCDNEVDILCHSLGLSGPDDFAISVEDWENRRARSPSDIFPRSRLLFLESSESMEPVSVSREELQDSQPDNGSRADIRSVIGEDSDCGSPSQNNGEGNGAIPDDQTSVLVSLEPNVSLSPRISNSSVPSLAQVLKPPPYMVCLPTSRTMLSSSWDIIRSFGPDDDGPDCGIERTELADAKDLPVLLVELVEQEGMVGDTSEDSTSNDDEIPSATTEIVTAVSPNSKLKGRIKSWTPGQLLGCGSYGRVFEAISEEGVFFAVKEVSSNAYPCVSQLEQEIALLSQFEHENIVQYYGTDKGY